MAINIPIPKTFLQSFLDTRKQGSEEDLHKAQMAQAYGAANKSNMIANLLNGGSAGGAPGAGGGGSGSMNLNRALLLSGAMGFTVPPPVNGVYHTAFGDFKGGPSDVEKGQQQVSEKTQQEANATDIKRSEKLKEDYSSTRNTYLLYKDLQDLLKKNPSLTGLGPNVKRWIGQSSDPDVAAFHQISTQLQAALAKLGGQRGGQAVLNWAKSAKPSAGNKGVYNMGMINSALKNLKREYDNVNREYRDIRGHGLPGLDEQNDVAPVSPQRAPMSPQVAPDQQGAPGMPPQGQQQDMGGQSQSPDQGAPPQGNGEDEIVMMVRPDNKVVRVHKSNVQKAIQEYKFKPVQ